MSDDPEVRLRGSVRAVPAPNLTASTAEDAADVVEVQLRRPAVSPAEAFTAGAPSASPSLVVQLDDEPVVSASASSGLVVSLDDIAVTRAPVLAALRRRPADRSPGVLRVGSSPDCDLVIAHPAVSPVHAELRNTPRGAQILDVSQGRTRLVVNGRFVHDAYLREGDRIGIGPTQFELRDRRLVEAHKPLAAPVMWAAGVSVTAGRRTLLHPTWLDLRPGELVAFLGESGAGKSTLLRLLAGVTGPATGAVLLEGEPVATRKAEIGYVPQDEIVHPSLTVLEALRYAARLRLPRDAPRAIRAAAVAQVLDEVGLADHARTRIGALSGGQRRRVGVATELVSRPQILFLDEPTTGLDPGLEGRLMRLFRSLADGGRAVVLVTHAVQSLDLCDRIVVMARGGQVAFAGSPADARAFFGIAELEGLYDVLDRAPEGAWHQRFLTTPYAAGWGAAPPSALGAARPAVARAAVSGGHLATLVVRQLRLLVRDRRTVLSLLLQVPLFAAAITLLFDGHVFDRPLPGRSEYRPAELHAAQSGQMLFLLITIAFWFGALAAAREIVKERAVLERELDIGLRPATYVLAKSMLLTVTVSAQVVGLAALVLTARPMHEAPSAYAGVVVLMLLVALAGAALGLTVSVAAGSEDQAMSLVPVLLVPQLLLGGAVVALHHMGAVMRVVAMFAPVQWAYAGAGSAIDLDRRGRFDQAFVANYGRHFFDRPPPLAAIVLLVMIAALMALVIRRVGSIGSTA